MFEICSLQQGRAYGCSKRRFERVPSRVTVASCVDHAIVRNLILNSARRALVRTLTTGGGRAMLSTLTNTMSSSQTNAKRKGDFSDNPLAKKAKKDAVCWFPIPFVLCQLIFRV